MFRSCTRAVAMLSATIIGSCGVCGELDVLPLLKKSDDRLIAAEPGLMLHRYLMDHVHEACEQRRNQLESLNSVEDLRSYQQERREYFLSVVGPLPQRTPLNATITGRAIHDGYRIEKVIFESQPKHYVTAILYLPDSPPPYPGVLVPCGHSANGKARDLYQQAPILLARNGIAAFCYDPIDQGERHQWLDAKGNPVLSASTQAHNLLGVGATLLGRNTATFRIWDGMRAIDYLQSRQEIDGSKIGCTGISGGGTATSYLMALDDRVVAAAPGCYLTSFERLLETIGPQDAEQNLFGQIKHGLDHADFAIMRAPKPTLWMTATDDYFDIDGAWQGYRQAKRFYAHMGHSERVDIFETAGGHGFPSPMRVAATRFMRRWLLGVDDAIIEESIPVATDEQLRCTPRGEVMLLPGAKSVYDLNQTYARQLAEDRRAKWKNLPARSLLAEARRVTGIRSFSDIEPPPFEVLATIQNDGYEVQLILIRAEPGILLPALGYMPEHPNGEAILSLHQEGKEIESDDPERLIDKVRQGYFVLSADVRGLGETKASGEHSYKRYLPPDWRDITISYLLGKSLMSMRADDIYRCAHVMIECATPEHPWKKMHLVSVGHIGVPALHAAALEPGLFDSCTLRQFPEDWSASLEPRQENRSLENVVHGVLAVYDLPELIDTIPKDELRLFRDKK